MRMKAKLAQAVIVCCLVTVFGLEVNSRIDHDRVFQTGPTVEAGR